VNSERCLPGPKFEYSAGGDERYRRNSPSPFGSLQLYTAPIIRSGQSDQFGTKGVVVADFNGDGRTDILGWSTTPSENQLWSSNGDGSFTKSLAFNITNDLLFSPDGCTQVIARDFNGDGLVDLLRFFDTGNYSSVQSVCTSTGLGFPLSTLLFLNRGDGTFARTAITGVDLLRSRQPNLSMEPTRPEQGVGTWWNEGREFYLMDVDGDGVLDAITTMRPGRSLWSAWEAFKNQCEAIVCTRVYKGDGLGGFGEIPSNLAHLSLYSNDSAPALGGSPLDFDQDGLPDLVILDYSQAGVPGFNYVARSRGDGSFDFYSFNEPYFTLTLKTIIDYNGDGRWDLFSAMACGPTSCPNTMAVKDTGTVKYSNVSNFNVTSPDDLFTIQMQGPSRPVQGVPMDFNGDGKQDLLNSATGASRLMMSAGDGSFALSTSFNLPALRIADGTNYVSAGSVVLGDFTGHGTPEFLMLGVPATLYVKTDPSPPDLLMTVTSETGARSQLTYVPLSNPVLPGDPLGPRYAGDRGTVFAAVLPKQDVTPPMYVVATLETDNGAGGMVKSEQSYAGLKVDTRGRDNLGFRMVRRQTPAPNGAPKTSEATMSQEFPYVGMPLTASVHRSTLNATAPGNRLSRVVNVLCDQTAPAGAEEAAIASGAPCTSTQVIRRPYALWSQTTEFDLLGMALPTTTTRTAVNANGDPTETTTTTTLTHSDADTYGQIASTQYWPDNTGCTDTQTCAWILSRARQNTVRATAPSTILSTGAGNAPNAADTAGSSARPPLNPAVLAIILQILLED
jgi:hypothetical protein